MLPTMETICRTLLKLTTTLENRPDLKQQLRLQFDDQGKRVTLSDNVEKVIQNALFACLIERSANRNGIKDGKPEGKKIGIYIFANMQLKLLSQVSEQRKQVEFISNKLLVSQMENGREHIYKHHPEISTTWLVSCFPACYVSLLPGQVSFLEYALLLRSESARVCLCTMPRPMHFSAPSDPCVPYLM